MRSCRTLALLGSILFLVFLGAPDAQAGGYSGGFWWQNCPATADFPAVSGDTNGSAYQSPFRLPYTVGTLSLDHLVVGASDSGGTTLECHYGINAVTVLSTKSPVTYPYCRATGSFGWFQCHQ